MAPPIEKMPLAGLHLLHNMAEGGWRPQAAYGRHAGMEYWQVIGVWGEVRAEGWWRRQMDASWAQWKSRMIVTVRRPDQGLDDFRALEPRSEGADAPVPFKISPIALTAHVLSPGWFTSWVTAKAAKSGRV